MRAYLGFIPLGVVGLPFLVAMIRQALFYRGCMDGFGYVLIAMAAFMFGGVLNVIYLVVAAATYPACFRVEGRWQGIAAKAGFAAALLLFVVQMVVLAGIVWKRLSMD